LTEAPQGQAGPLSDVSARAIFSFKFGIAEHYRDSLFQDHIIAKIENFDLPQPEDGVITVQELALYKRLIPPPKFVRGKGCKISGGDLPQLPDPGSQFLGEGPIPGIIGKRDGEDKRPGTGGGNTKPA
jgi:hypothetical protein